MQQDRSVAFLQDQIVSLMEAAGTNHCVVQLPSERAELFRAMWRRRAGTARPNQDFWCDATVVLPYNCSFGAHRGGDIFVGPSSTAVAKTYRWIVFLL